MELNKLLILDEKILNNIIEKGINTEQDFYEYFSLIYYFNFNFVPDKTKFKNAKEKNKYLLEEYKKYLIYLLKKLDDVNINKENIKKDIYKFLDNTLSDEKKENFYKYFRNYSSKLYYPDGQNFYYPDMNELQDGLKTKKYIDINISALSVSKAEKENNVPEDKQNNIKKQLKRKDVFEGNKTELEKLIKSKLIDEKIIINDYDFYGMLKNQNKEFFKQLKKILGNKKEISPFILTLIKKLNLIKNNIFFQAVEEIIKKYCINNKEYKKYINENLKEVKKDYKHKRIYLPVSDKFEEVFIINKFNNNVELKEYMDILRIENWEKFRKLMKKNLFLNSAMVLSDNAQNISILYSQIFNPKALKYVLLSLPDYDKEFNKTDYLLNKIIDKILEEEKLENIEINYLVNSVFNNPDLNEELYKKLNMIYSYYIFNNTDIPLEKIRNGIKNTLNKYEEHIDKSFKNFTKDKEIYYLSTEYQQYFKLAIKEKFLENIENKFQKSEGIFELDKYVKDIKEKFLKAKGK